MVSSQFRTLHATNAPAGAYLSPVPALPPAKSALLNMLRSQGVSNFTVPTASVPTLVKRALAGTPVSDLTSYSSVLPYTKGTLEGIPADHSLLYVVAQGFLVFTPGSRLLLNVSTIHQEIAVTLLGVSTAPYILVRGFTAPSFAQPLFPAPTLGITHPARESAQSVLVPSPSGYFVLMADPATPTEENVTALMKLLDNQNIPPASATLVRQVFAEVASTVDTLNRMRVANLPVPADSESTAE